MRVADFFFFNDTATTEIYTLSLHDALPICVDAVEARGVDGRRTDAEVDLGRAGLAQQGNYLAGGGATHDRVVDDDQPLAGNDLAQRAQLDCDATLAHALVWLDERPAGVAVADHPLSIRQARAFRVTGRGRCARVRHRHHDVGLDCGLRGQGHAHTAPRLVEVAAEHVRIRPAEVDKLEDAQLLVAFGEADRNRIVALFENDDLAGLDVSNDHAAGD